MKLVVASLNYSSWSVRAWLSLTHAEIEFDCEQVPLESEADWKRRVTAHSRAGKVPVLLDGDLVIHESLAICEYASELRPDAGLWPEARAERAMARAYSAEMASGFPNLRAKLPMNFRARSEGFRFDPETLHEIDRVTQIWETCRRAADSGPYLFGRFGIVDAMYLPVACRFRTYGVELGGVAAEYASALWQQPAVRKWTLEAEAAPAIRRYDDLL
jgi:glutathione S-transferase